MSEAPEAAARPSAPQHRDEGFYIPSLDGIRCVSFTTVYLAHAGLGSFVPGYFGLNLFFFLSGFLITTLLRQEFEAKGEISFKEFYLRRAFRILPPFYLVLFVACGLTLLGFTEGSVNLEGFVAQACHYVNYYIVSHGWWTGLAPGTWVYWSLAVEEHFYLGFPLLYLWSSRRLRSPRKQALLMYAICALVLLWRCVLIFGLHAAKDRAYVATDTRIDSILAGCILAIFGNPVVDVGAIDDRRLARVWLPLGFVAIALGLGIRRFEFEQTLRYTLQSFGLAPFFVAAMRWPDKWPFRALNWPIIRRIGVLSYSMYLMHTYVLWCIEQRTHWPMPVRAVVTYVLLFALASAINRYLEKPAAALRRRITRSMRQPAIAPDPALR